MADIDFHSISFQQLVECLKDYIGEAPIHFTPIDELDKSNYILCRFMGNEEAEAIRHGNHNTGTQYDNSDAGIHLPDVTIDQFFAWKNGEIPPLRELFFRSLMQTEKCILRNRISGLHCFAFCMKWDIGSISNKADYLPLITRNLNMT